MGTVIEYVDRTTLAFENAKSFFSTDKTVIAATTPRNGTSHDVTPQEPAATVEVDRFPLEENSFVDLQVYLRAAMRLPKDEAAFKLQYPQDLFEVRTKRDTSSPVLYGYMVKVLTEIHQHCFDFQVGPMNRMMVLSGEIAEFSWRTTKGINDLETKFGIITESGSSFADAKVKTAAEDISNILEILQKKAVEMKNRCENTWTELSKFKETTTIDKQELEKVSARSGKVLPTIDDLNATMRARANTTYQQLNDLAKQENDLRRKAQNKSGAKWYYFIPWVGLGLCLADTISKGQALQTLATANREYESVFKDASEELRTAIYFRNVCKDLSDNITSVSKAIEKAVGALQNMMVAFSNLQVGLGSIASDLDGAKGSVTEEVARKRRKALENLTAAKDMWIKVHDLATRFEKHGVVLEEDLTKVPDTPEPYPWLEVVSANYGGVDVSEYAKILLNYGDSIRIRTVEPGFHEAWEGVKKSISVLHQLRDNQRIFSCREYSGQKYLHLLEPKKNIAEQHVYEGELNEIKPLNKSSGADIQILAITWGANEVRKQSVYDYCYSKFNSGAIDWTNDNMGGDTWPGNNKSGTIYYKVRNEIKQCTGREYTSTSFTV